MPRRKFNLAKSVRKRKRKMRKRLPITKNFPLYNVATNRKLTHRYINRITLNPAGAGRVFARFSCANILDDVQRSPTDATHLLPMGVNTMNELFENYYVEHARCKVTFCGTAPTDPDDEELSTLAPYNKVPYLVTVQCIQDGSPQLGILGVMQQSRAKWKVVPINNQQTTLYSHYNPHKMFGYKDIADADDLYGSKNLNPVADCFFVVAADSFDTATVLGNIYCIVEIDFSVVWNTPSEQSLNVAP